MQQLLARLAELAPLGLPVLLTGEAGTGKHRLAQALHQLSQRPGPLWVVNATALPVADLLLQLYGQERPRRDGGTDITPGLLESAQGGTLLFEEVAELDAGGQHCLRQLLSEPTYSRRGSAQLRHADVRVIALTSRPLLPLVQQGAFCAALFQRLTPGWLAVPPLRQRREDIPRLIAAFLAAGRPPQPPTELPAATLLQLLGHSWPGNVRELRELVRQAGPVELTSGRARAAARTLDPELVAQLLAQSRAPREVSFPLGTPLATVYRDLILMTLAAVAGNKKDAAALLGVSRGALYSRLRTYSAQARTQWRTAQQSPVAPPPDSPPASPSASQSPTGAQQKSGSRQSPAAVKPGRQSSPPKRPDAQADPHLLADCSRPAPADPARARRRR
jgi:DNA-binding NtrC family response regulator